MLYLCVHMARCIIICKHKLLFTSAFGVVDNKNVYNCPVFRVNVWVFMKFLQIMERLGR